MRTRPRTVGLSAVLAAAALTGTAHALIPTDPEAAHPAYAALELPAAWDRTTGSPAVVIAIVDSGIDSTHPDLAGAVRQGRDFVERDDNATDPQNSGHGTAVAGVAAARANNGFGGVGSCFGCDVLPLRVLRPEGYALNADTAAAIDYAVDRGAAVVNTSIYGESSPDGLRQALVRARAAGVLVVAAAGNEGKSTPEYPAAFPEAISVAAAEGGRLAPFSSFGDWVKFAAPACAPVTVIGGTSAVACGTSVSTPLVAGIVALLRAQAPYATADELENALATTARPISGTRFGLVDATAALDRLGRPELRLRPTVVGTPVVGVPLDAFSGVWAGAGIRAAFQWERCRAACEPILGATASRYSPSAEDAGAGLRVTVSSSEAGTASSATTASVTARARALQQPLVIGRPRVGSRLTARAGAWSGTDLTFSIRWQRCRDFCTDVAGGTRYRIRRADRGHRLRIEVRASNALGTVTVFSRLTSVIR